MKWIQNHGRILSFEMLSPSLLLKDVVLLRNSPLSSWLSIITVTDDISYDAVDL